MAGRCSQPRSKHLILPAFLFGTLFLLLYFTQDAIAFGHSRYEMRRQSRFVRSMYSKYGGRYNHFVSCSHRKNVCSSILKDSKKGKSRLACCWGRVCKDLSSDPNNCGKCGRACNYGRSCCGGRCVNLTNDKRNCGSCGQRCSDGDKCSFGMCDYGDSYTRSHRIRRRNPRNRRSSHKYGFPRPNRYR
ncbi:hypothetical protein KP509_03G017300 [Ceratopteris richardii]|uniref:Stigma-specific STIG1-like protein 1 n=1 Tax=Ceratopteris richardii TaxID=49495 RepID=A0A8T2V1W9_CERRI|nr:hypothetical protein KP509_03G017300 [Ceratopteris richardii]